MARKFADKFYKSKSWQCTRAAYAASVGWLCENCLKYGKYNYVGVVNTTKKGNLIIIINKY